MIDTVGTAMHLDFHLVPRDTALPHSPPEQITVVVDRDGQPLAVVGDERRWPAVLLHPDTSLATVLTNDWLMNLLLQGLPAMLVWVNGSVAGVVAASTVLDEVAATYGGPAAAITTTLGQTLDLEATGDPKRAPAALIRCRTCAAINRVDREPPTEPQCRNGHPLDPDFG